MASLTAVAKEATLLIVKHFSLQLNSYDLTKATLDHATRIVRLLSTCTYVRIEAQMVTSKYRRKKINHHRIIVFCITNCSKMKWSLIEQMSFKKRDVMFKDEIITHWAEA